MSILYGYRDICVNTTDYDPNARVYRISYLCMVVLKCRPFAPLQFFEKAVTFIYGMINGIIF